MDTVGILYREDLKRGATALYELSLTLAMADGIIKFKLMLKKPGIGTFFLFFVLA